MLRRLRSRLISIARIHVHSLSHFPPPRMRDTWTHPKTPHPRSFAHFHPHAHTRAHSQSPIHTLAHTRSQRAGRGQCVESAGAVRALGDIHRRTLREGDGCPVLTYPRAYVNFLVHRDSFIRLHAYIQICIARVGKNPRPIVCRVRTVTAFGMICDFVYILFSLVLP